MYRILAANQPVRERRNQRSHPCYTKPELVATGPNQTLSWDITRLRGPKRWTSFYLYVLLDMCRCLRGTSGSASASRIASTMPVNPSSLGTPNRLGPADTPAATNSSASSSPSGGRSQTADRPRDGSDPPSSQPPVEPPHRAPRRTSPTPCQNRQGAIGGAFLRRRDRTARPLRVGHYSSAVNRVNF